jgi:hypothetical protein
VGGCRELGALWGEALEVDRLLGDDGVRAALLVVEVEVVHGRVGSANAKDLGERIGGPGEEVTRRLERRGVLG